MIALSILIAIVLFTLADLQPLKVVDEVFETHPECAIVLCLDKADFLLNLIRPELRVMGPITIPLEAGPWIAYLH